MLHTKGCDAFLLKYTNIFRRLVCIVAFFVQLLNNSRQNMEEAFGQSFGYGSQMFVSLYRDLKSYYKVCWKSVLLRVYVAVLC